MLAGALELQMFANLARLASDMQEAKTMVGSSMKSIEGSVNLAKKALGALGIGLSVNYFVGLVRGSIDAADRLNDLSKTTRISVEMLAGLKLAAKQSGTDLESLAGSLNKLGQNIGKDPEKYKKLGITAKDTFGQMKQLADITNRLSDENQRNAVLSTALGKSWQTTASFMSDGSEKMQEMVDKGTRLAGMTGEMAREADDMKDKLAELEMSLDANTKKLAFALLPAISDVVGAMAGAAKETAGWKVALIGLGGVFSWILGITDSQKLAKRVQEIDEQLRIARKQMASGSLNPAGASESWFSFLIPDVKLGEEAKTRLRETIQQLIAERDRLVPPTPVAATKSAADAAKEAQERAAAEAAARAFLETTKQRDEAYQSLMKSINELSATQRAELDGESKLTEGQKLALKTMVDLRDGKNQYTDAQKRAIAANLEGMLAVDKELQQKKEWIELQKIILEQLVKQIEETERLNAVVTNRFTENAKQIEDIKFETELLKKEAAIGASIFRTKEEELRLMSKVNLAREIAVAQRQIELQLERDLLALGPEINAAYLEREKQLRAQAQAQKEAVAGVLEAREAARLGNEINRNTGSEFRDLWNTVESTGKQAFVSLLTHGRSSMKSIGEAIKSSIIDLLYQLTLRKWIINIGASLSGSVVSGAASAAGSSIGGSIFGSILNGNGASTGSGLISTITGGFDSVFQSAGVAMGSQFVADIGNYGMGLPVVGGLLRMASGDVAGGAGSMIGGAIGSYFGPIGTAVGSFIGGSLFGGGSSKPPDSVLKILQNDDGTISLLAKNVTGAGNQKRNPEPYLQAAAILNQLPPELLDPLVGLKVKKASTNSAEKMIEKLFKRPEIQQALAAFEQMKSEFTASITNQAGVLGALSKFQTELSMSAYLSPLDQLAGARSNFESILTRAKTGDQGAIAALSESGNQYLSIGRSVYASGTQFQDIFNQVRGGVAGIASDQQANFEMMLRETPAAIQAGFADQIKALRDGFDSVVEAVNKLSSGLRQAGVSG